MSRRDDSSGDLLHFLVRAAIKATPPGSMRMMSAGLMVELLVDQGLAKHQAKRLFSQIRKGAPLHDEWHDAFKSGRFQQRQGRATLAAPLSVAPQAQMMAQQAQFFSSTAGGYRDACFSGNNTGVLFSTAKWNCDTLDNRSNDNNSSYSSAGYNNQVPGDTREDEDSKSDPVFALLMLGRSSSEAAPSLSPNNNKRRRETEDHGVPYTRPHPSVAQQPQAQLQAQFQAQLQTQMQAHTHHDNYHLLQERLALQSSIQQHSQLQQSLQLQRAQEQMHLRQQMGGVGMNAHAPPDLGGGLSQFPPFYHQNTPQLPQPGTTSDFYSALCPGSLASMKPQPLHTFSSSCGSSSGSSTSSSSSSSYDIPSSSSSIDSDHISLSSCVTGVTSTAGTSAAVDVAKSAEFAAALAGAAPLTSPGPGGLPITLEQPLVGAPLRKQQLHNAFGVHRPPKIPHTAFLQGQLEQAHFAAQHTNQYHHLERQNMQQQHWAAATASVAKAAAVQAMHGQHRKNIDEAGVVNGGDL